MKPKRTVCQSVPGSESEVRRLSLCPRRGGAPPPRGDLKGGAGKEGVERSRYLPTIPPAPPHSELLFLPPSFVAFTRSTRSGFLSAADLVQRRLVCARRVSVSKNTREV